MSLPDLGKPYDVAAFEEICTVAFDSASEYQAEAQDLLVEFKENHDSWIVCDDILSNSENEIAQFLALDILCDLIRYRWLILSDEDQLSLQDFIFSQLLKHADETEVSEDADRTVVMQFAKAAALIVFRIPENMNTLQGLATSNNRLMAMLEIIEAGLDEELWTSSDEVESVSELVAETLSSVEDSVILCQALKCVKFTSLPIMPLLNFLGSDEFTVKISCLQAILNQIENTDNIVTRDQLKEFLVVFLELLLELLPIKEEDAENYDFAPDFDIDDITKEQQKFLNVFLQVLLTTLKKVLPDIIKRHIVLDDELFFKTLWYLVYFLPNFTFLIEFWKFFWSTVFQSNNEEFSEYLKPFIRPYLNMLNDGFQEPGIYRLEIEFGQQKEVETEDTYLFDLQKETLRHLTAIFPSIILNFYFDAFEYRIDPKYAWSFSCISGILPEKQETRLLSFVLQRLLDYCEAQKHSEDRIVIAGCVLLVAVSFRSFLRRTPNFRDVVIRKIFDFFIEEKVRDMAVDIWYKLCTNGAGEFKILHLNWLKVIEDNLDETQQLRFYSGIGLVIAHRDTKDIKRGELSDLMDDHNDEFYTMVREVEDADDASDVSSNMYEALEWFLKLNISLLDGLKGDFEMQIKKIFEKCIALFEQSVYLIVQGGYHDYLWKILNLVLILFTKFISCANTSSDIYKDYFTADFLENIVDMFVQLPVELMNETFLQLIEAILTNYRRMFDRGDGLVKLKTLIMRVYDSVFEHLEVDQHEYHDLRSALYRLVNSLVRYFRKSFKLNSDNKEFVVSNYEFLYYGLGNPTMICRLACNAMYRFWNMFGQEQRLTEEEEELKAEFIVDYYFPTIERVFECLTDKLHTNYLADLSKLLFCLVKVVDEDYLFEYNGGNVNILGAFTVFLNTNFGLSLHSEEIEDFSEKFIGKNSSNLVEYFALVKEFLHTSTEYKYEDLEKKTEKIEDDDVDESEMSAL
ncbi:hypothetical protein PCE1_004714 [Barthelona sp. PCE]